MGKILNKSLDITYLIFKKILIPSALLSSLAFTFFTLYNSLYGYSIVFVACFIALLLLKKIANRTGPVIRTKKEHNKNKILNKLIFYFMCPIISFVGAIIALCAIYLNLYFLTIAMFICCFIINHCCTIFKMGRYK